MSAFALALGLLHLCLLLYQVKRPSPPVRWRQPSDSHTYLQRSCMQWSSSSAGCPAVAVTDLNLPTMPHATNGQDTDFKLIQVKELHPTFGAEVHGVDFSEAVGEDVFSEIHKAITKVSIIICIYLFSLPRSITSISLCP